MQSNNLTGIVAFVFLVNTVWAQSFQWLEGPWKQKDKPAYEVWEKGSGENLFEGTAFTISPAGDTVITEEIRFIREGKSFVYIPDVVGDQGPVRFTVTRHSKSGFIAENPAHDFPKKIAYTWYKKEGLLLATISGDGKSITFHFEKSKTVKP
jgi:hypothetical protein